MYTREFYDIINQGSVRSAERMVPWILLHYPVSSVVDVGCGEGAWLKVFKDYGLATLGIDGRHVDQDRLLIPREDFEAHDLSKLKGYGQRFDLAVSLEVAEHLPESSANDFVHLLTTLSDTIFFSAAIPGQSGSGHVNCQFPDYWVRKFARLGFGCVDVIRWEHWDDPNVEPWYCVPENAEIMTRSGWKTLGELRGDEVVLTLGSENTAEWQPMTGVQVFDYQGDMTRVGNRWLTTPEHRWPHYKQGSGKQIGQLRVTTASQLADQDHIIQVADDYDSGCVSVLNERDAAILGWILTDGSLKHRTRQLLHPQAVIYQSPKKYLEEILALLGDEASSVRWDRRVPGWDCATVLIRSCVMKRFAEVGFWRKEDIMSIVTRLDLKAARAMWWAMLKAEGNLNRNNVNGTQYESWVFSQNPGPVLDAFQYLSFILGHRVNVNGARHSVGGTGNGGKSSRTVPAKPTTRKGYSGKVWCPTTPNGTWVMRQDGAMCVTGNCQNSFIFKRGVTSSFRGNVVHPEIYAWHYKPVAVD